MHSRISESTQHHSHFPNAVSADAWNSFNQRAAYCIAQLEGS